MHLEIVELMTEDVHGLNHQFPCLRFFDHDLLWGYNYVLRGHYFYDVSAR